MTPRLEALLRESRHILSSAAYCYDVEQPFAMFSGGHDSLCAFHVALSTFPLLQACHINTTIGIPETQEFVRSTCRAYRTPLKEYAPPVSYRDIVLKHGFPGPGSHMFMYTRLKERCVRQLVREHKRHWGEKIMLITGVRLSESARRMGHVKPIQKEGAKLWVSPILNWTDEDKDEYMILHGLQRNPVVDALCMSGECLCGAFAKPEELAELSVLFPDVAEEIKDLQRQAEVMGVPAKWGHRPPGSAKSKSGRMCSSCAERA